MIFQRFKNGPLALQYLFDQLADGTTLARLVGDSADLRRGTLFVGVPLNIKPDDLSEFRWEIAGIRTNDSQTLFEALIARFIKDPMCEVLFQDTMSRPSDPATNFEPKHRKVAIGEEVYWNLKAPTAEKEIYTVMNWGSPNPYSAFFRRSADKADTPPTIVYDDLKQIASEIVGIATDAFDATSFVVWWREDLYRFPLSD
jgi:hypothetical protein